MQINHTVRYGTVRYTCNGAHFSLRFFHLKPLPLLPCQMKLPIAVDDVRREVDILEKLSGHPNVVQFRAAFEDEELVYIAMEYGPCILPLCATLRHIAPLSATFRHFLPPSATLRHVAPLLPIQPWFHLYQVFLPLLLLWVRILKVCLCLTLSIEECACTGDRLCEGGELLDRILGK